MNNHIIPNTLSQRMSPGQNINDNSSDPTTNSIMNSYKVNVGEQTFRLYRSSITFDAPNFFTPFLGEEANSGDAEANEIFITVSGSDGTGKDNDPPVIVETTKSKSSGHTQNYFTSDSEVTIDRDPKLFEVILRYLRGYNIFPLSSINLPPGMSLDLFRESLLEDARFYGLDRLAQLLQAETPTPLRYKDPFTSADKILLSLRDVPIHKDFIKSKLDGSSTIEFFTGAVLTIDLEPSDASIRFNTKFLNEQDQKALETLGEICGENTQIEFSRQLYANMKDALNGIRLEIDGVQVTGMDIASVGTNQRVKALEDMFRISGGQRLIIYAQEFVFRLDRIQPSTIDGNQIGTDNVCNSQNCTQDNNEKDNINGIIQSDANGVKVSVRDGEEDIEHNNEKTNKTVNAKEIDNPSHSEKSNVSKITNENSSNNNVNEGDMMYLGVVWAKGWTQEWWAWNEYRMKLDALQ